MTQTIASPELSRTLAGVLRACLEVRTLQQVSSGQHTVASNMITDRLTLGAQGMSIADTESCCQKNQLPLRRQICGNVGRASLIRDTDSPLHFNEFLLQIQTLGSK